MLYNTAFKNYSCEKGYGYYLDNKKEFLDANNESYWSPGEKKVYFISSGFTENSELRGSIDHKGIVIGPDTRQDTLKSALKCRKIYTR